MALNRAANESSTAHSAGQGRGEVSRLFPRGRSVAMVAAPPIADRNPARLWWWWIGLSGRSTTATGTTAARADASNATHTADTTTALGRAWSRCAPRQCNLQG